MNVCFVTQAFVRHENDAIGSFVFRLGEALAERGVNVRVIAPHAPGLAIQETIGHTQIDRFRYGPTSLERLAYQGAMHHLVQKSPLNAALFGSFLAGFVAQTVGTARAHKADLLHAHWWFPSGLVGAIASRITGIPLVITCHGTDVGLLRSHGFLMPLARRVFMRAAAVAAVSEYLRQQVLEHMPQLGDRLSVIPMPVSHVFKDAPERTPASHSGRQTVVAVGRLARQKGFHDLIAAGHLLQQHGRDLGITLIGEGEEEASLRAMADRLQMAERVTFAGVQTAEQIAVALRACDVAVLPAQEEGLGLALLEAMFCGAPVVGTRSGGIANVISDGATGVLTPAPI